MSDAELRARAGEGSLRDGKLGRLPGADAVLRGPDEGARLVDRELEAPGDLLHAPPVEVPSSGAALRAFQLENSSSRRALRALGPRPLENF
jgi:hypothetical protein